MRRYFGTDGMRGRANQFPILPEEILRLALAAGQYFRSNAKNPRVIIGKDTRLSGYMLETAMTAGFISMGLDVRLVGPLPTPAVAMLTRSLRAQLGVMLSASHNPYQDNGIKLFGPDGYKLSDQTEIEIESLMLASNRDYAPPERMGRARRIEDARGRYVEFVKSGFPDGLRLDGIRVVIDCANGAAYRVAPDVLFELGADVIPVAVEPDGTNINQHCGAVFPDRIATETVKHKADIGIALDGDADRLILSDSKGRLLDGDRILALLARHWLGKERLSPPLVTGSVLSNLGLERFLDTHGIALHRAPVGDRYISEHMRAHSCVLGGEPSGHIMFAKYGTTGDGLIAALQTLAVLVEEEQDSAHLARIFMPIPQKKRDIALRHRGENPLEHETIRFEIEKNRARLGAAGRLVVRKSGTEPMLRIMAEGEDEPLLTDIVDSLADTLNAYLSAS